MDRARWALPSLLPLASFASGLFTGLIVGLALLIALALFPALFGYYPLVVLSGSMSPTLRTGDIAVVHRVSPGDLQIGDVLTYASAAGLVTHRIVAVDITPRGEYFLMRGDANSSTDARPISPEAIVGKVLYRIPRLGFLVSFATSLEGRVLFVATPLLIISLAWTRAAIRRRSLSAKAHDARGDGDHGPK